MINKQLFDWRLFLAERWAHEFLSYEKIHDIKQHSFPSSLSSHKFLLSVKIIVVSIIWNFIDRLVLEKLMLLITWAINEWITWCDEGKAIWIIWLFMNTATKQRKKFPFVCILTFCVKKTYAYDTTAEERILKHSIWMHISFLFILYLRFDFNKILLGSTLRFHKNLSQALNLFRT